MIRIVKRSIAFLTILIITLLLVNQLVWIADAKIKAENLEINKLENNKDDFVCVLKPEKRKYKIGEQPELVVEIINKTDSTVLMVGSLDGSDIGWRLPKCQFSVRHQLFGNISFTTLRCGNINPLDRLDFNEVQANSIFDPYENENGVGYFSSRELDWPNFLIPGIYKIKFFYSTKNEGRSEMTNAEKLESDESLKEWYFKEGKESVYYQQLKSMEILDSLWNQVPKIEMMSNEITIEYNL